MKRVVIILIVLLIRCEDQSNNESETIAEMRSLIFIDPIRTAIRDNKIDTTFTFIPLKQPFLSDEELLLHITPYFLIDSLNAQLHSFTAFNENGNIISEERYRIMGAHQSFEYDSNWFLTKKIFNTDYKIEWLIETKYDAEKNQLKQLWKSSSHLLDTTIFEFTDHGVLVKEKGQFHDDLGYNMTYTKEYTYDESQLVGINTIFHKGRKGKKTTKESFFYENGILRKIIRDNSYDQSEKNSYGELGNEILYFGADGLIDSLIDNQRIKLTFTHK